VLIETKAQNYENRKKKLNKTLVLIARVSDTAAFSSADRVGKQRLFGLVCSAIIEARKA